MVPNEDTGRRFVGRAVRGLALAFAALSVSAPARASTHPPDLAAEGDCDAWVGTVNGNDPDMRVSARICPASGGDAVRGRFQTSSLKSGYSVRDFEGRWVDGKKRLDARDVRLVEDRPNPGWRFCTVDRYDLLLETPDRLAGKLHAEACSDHASVVLTRVPRPSPPAGSASSGGPPVGTATGASPSPSPSPSGTSAPPPDPPRPVDPTRRGVGPALATATERMRVRARARRVRGRARGARRARRARSRRGAAPPGASESRGGLTRTHVEPLRPR
ncbi:MAG: hypothetical protein IT373_19300 [Polyangiaceae bacterium]|nr:hypothetical protein [Polyangiaceae bacterium]